MTEVSENEDLLKKKNQTRGLRMCEMVLKDGQLDQVLKHPARKSWNDFGWSIGPFKGRFKEPRNYLVLLKVLLKIQRPIIIHPESGSQIHSSSLFSFAWEEKVGPIWILNFPIIADRSGGCAGYALNREMYQLPERIKVLLANILAK